MASGSPQNFNEHYTYPAVPYEHQHQTITADRTLRSRGGSFDNTIDSANRQLYVRDKNFFLAIAALCICSFQVIMDSIVVASALPAIAEDLNGASNQSYWCSTAFTFVMTVTMPIYGALVPIFGMKNCMLAALLVFLTMSILCATAQNIFWLIAARAVQGAGAGGLNTLINVIVCAMCPIEERGTYCGITIMVGAVGIVAGIILGAAISSLSTWRIIFWINVPISAVALIGIWFFLKLPMPKVHLGKLKTVDWTGLAILSGSLTGLLYGITGGDVLFPWTSVPIVLALVLGSVGLVVFVGFERYYALNPAIPIRVFNDRTAASGFFLAWIHSLVVYSSPFYLILYFLLGHQHSLLRAAVLTLPGAASVPFMAAVAGFAMTYTKRFQPFNLAGCVFMTIGMGLFITFTPTSSVALTTVAQMVLAIGSGFPFAGRLLAVQARQRPEDEAIATNLISFFGALGEASGTAIGGSIFQNAWNDKVNSLIQQGKIDQRFYVSAREAEAASTRLATFPEAVQTLYAEIASNSLQRVWIVLCAFSALIIVTTLAQKNIKLSEASTQPRQDSEALVHSGKSFDSEVTSKSLPLTLPEQSHGRIPSPIVLDLPPMSPLDSWLYRANFYLKKPEQNSIPQHLLAESVQQNPILHP